jgi:hypothetical protein
MYAVSANEMRYAVNGVDRMRWQAGGLPTQTYNVATGLWEDLEPVGVVGPNLLHNSNFQIAQRGTGPFSLAAAGNYGIDRWASVQNSTTHEQDNNSRQTYLSASRSTSSGTILIAQPIRFDQRAEEPFRAGTTFTLSWEQNSDSQTGGGCRVSFAKDWLAANFEDIYTATAIKVCPANQWTRVTATFTLANNAVDAGMDRVLVEVGAYDPANIVPAGEKLRIRNVKLEEGNTFTGYEPTPYAIDEAECMKWYQVPFDTDSISPFYANIFRSAGAAAAQDHVMNVQIRPKMYAAPSTVDETYIGAVAPDSVQTNRNSMRLIWTNTVSPTSEVGVDNLALSCEL